MKVGILTYYNVFNHGAVLQANALKTVLESMGNECEFVRFNRNYDFIPQGQDKKYNIGLNSIALYAAYLMKKGIRNTVFNLKKSAVLKEYRRANLPMGERYTDFTADAVVIGSDEVFSLEIGINPFFYGHGLRAERVFSYAGSFGPTTLETVRNRGLEQLVSSGLRAMDAVSTRDENSAAIVEALTGKRKQIVCDPVILYGYEREIRQYIPDAGDYIIVYSYDNHLNNPEETTYIRDYAKKHGLKVYSAGFYHGWCDRNIQATPVELLGWIKNAALVVTDTFHGAVLSLICSTPMIVKLRENQNKLAYLMREYDLDNRIIDEFKQIETVADGQVDFCHVNDILRKRRASSMAYLKQALGD